MKDRKNCLVRLFAALAALAALAAAVYAVYQNWELIRGFFQEHCPACKRRARMLEFEDYVD